jgi:3-oxoacyl-[acyl-carrier protein] reductase
MDLDLKDKVALVTGASVGLGRTIARMLSDEGCRLAVVARRSALLEALADEIAGLGRERPLVIAQDITGEGAADAIRAAVEGRFGGLDILVNNAGGSRPLTGLGTPQEWDEAMRLNFVAGRELAHAFIDAMRAKRYGRIINITGGDEPVAMNAGVPPNGAVHIWAKALSRVVGADGITVNCIPPGRIHSEQIDQRLLPTPEAQRTWVEQNCPAGYIGGPEDLGALVVFLASPRARYITGQVIHVDGGARRFSH